MTTLDSQGVYSFAYCGRDIVNPKVVDAGAERDCQHHPFYVALPELNAVFKAKYEATLARRRKGWRGLWRRVRHWLK